MRALDLVGKRINRFTVLSKIDKVNKNGHTQWLCKCDCGNEWVVSSSNLRTTRECKECSYKTRSEIYIPNRGKNKNYYYIPDYGKRMQNVFNDKKINLTDMERVTGISRSTIYSFVYNGTDISTSRLAKICAYCGTSADYILGLKKEA